MTEWILSLDFRTIELIGAILLTLSTLNVIGSIALLIETFKGKEDTHQ